MLLGGEIRRLICIRGAFERECEKPNHPSGKCDPQQQSTHLCGSCFLTPHLYEALLVPWSSVSAFWIPERLQTCVHLNTFSPVFTDFCLFNQKYKCLWERECYSYCKGVTGRMWLNDTDAVLWCLHPSLRLKSFYSCDIIYMYLNLFMCTKP